MIRAENLAAKSGIEHGFFSRKNGVSTGIYEGRNCGLGSDDLRANVIENRGRIADDLGVPRMHLVTAYQIHSPDVVTVEQRWEHEAAPKADAMVTKRPGIALGILTADCTPILFADDQAGIIGAAHAGWKGAVTGVLEATLIAMEKLGASASNISAAIGPTISQTNYEVGPEFADTFIARNSAYERFFIPSAREDHLQFDLPAFVEDRLKQAGLASIERLNLCTYADPARFFSYRRTTHAGEPDYGRQISAITLKAPG
ncbi:MAG: peptidoglycan editing factor PgeF [Parvibaculum sp.]